MIEGPFTLKTWDDFPNDKPLPKISPFKVRLNTGQIVKIMPKNPKNHTPGFETSPVLFYNIPFILENADKIEESKSQTQKAIENRQKGKIMVYSKVNALRDMKLPDFSGKDSIDHVVEVVVQHVDKTKISYTATYNVKIKTI